MSKHTLQLVVDDGSTSHLPDFASAPNYMMLGSGLRHIGISDGEKIIASVWNHHHSEEAKTNATRIVKCCNAHDELLAACEAVISAFESFSEEHKEVEFDENICIGKVRAAIAKAVQS